MMKSIYKSSWFMALYAALALTVGLYISLLIVPIFLIWFSLIYFLILEFSRKSKAKKSLIFYFYLFPAVEILLYIALYADLPFYNGMILNVLEHGFAAFFMGLLSYEIISLNVDAVKLGNLSKALFVIGIVSLLGIFNEFWEFYLRVFSESEYCYLPICKIMAETSLAYYYVDSLKDLAVNILGAVMAVLLSTKRQKS